MVDKKTEDYNYFFVRGAPARSGTNWVCNLLNLHPEVYCTGEFNLSPLKLLLDEIIFIQHKILFFNPRTCAILIKNFEKMIRDCIFNVCEKEIDENVKLLGDRTPVRLIPELIRDSSHFLIYRDGRDVLVSLIYHYFNIDYDNKFFNIESIEDKKLKFKKNSNYFKENPSELLTDEKFVKEFANEWVKHMNLNSYDIKKIPEVREKSQIMVIRYESLFKDTEKIRNEMYKFLGLDPLLAKPLDELTSPGFKKENFKSHYRKGQPGDWKNYFTENTCKWFKEIAGQKLIDLGYENDMNWRGNL